MGYYAQFPMPIPRLGARSIVLLTRPPLTLAGSLDLHALATPPAFNLSQDQTLQLNFVNCAHFPERGSRSVRANFQRSVCLS